MKPLFLLASFLGLAAAGLSVGDASAIKVRYYAIFFASQGSPNYARSAHTWVTFVAMVGHDEVQREMTISWLPEEGFFGPGDTMPVTSVVPGKNYDLDETLRLTRIREITYWLPFEISEKLYRRSERRFDYLEAALTKYKMIPRESQRRRPLKNKPGGAVNCIIAVSDIYGYLNTGTEWGNSATEEVLEFFRSEIIDYPRQYVEVASAIHLDERIAAVEGVTLLVSSSKGE